MASSTPSSCEAGKPFIGLGDGSNAPILNYNLPQKTCYDVNAFYPLSIPSDYFIPVSVPTNTVWDIAAGMSVEEIITTLKQDIMGTRPSVLLQNAQILNKRKDLIRFLAESGIKYVVQDPKPETFIVGDGNLRIAPLHGDGGLASPSPGRNLRNSNQPPPRINHLTAIPNMPAERIQVAGYTLDYIAAQVANGLIPELVTRFGGKVMMVFSPKPTLKLRIAIVEHLKMCSFLGDYGAGKTVKTFSLLPGERTTITVRSYKDKTSSYVKSSSTTTNEYTSTYFADDESSYAQQSENILDSFSQHSADQVQEVLGRNSSSCISAMS